MQRIGPKTNIYEKKKQVLGQNGACSELYHLLKSFRLCRNYIPTQYSVKKQICQLIQPIWVKRYHK